MFPSPLITPPTLSDFQWEYNGLVFGAETPWGVLGVEGLDLAEIRSGDVPWPRDHGQAMGLDVYGGRDIIFDLWMVAGGTSLQARQFELAAATVVRPNEEIPLWFQLPNLPILCIMCRPRKRPMKVDSDYAAANVGKPELVLHATDPRIYGGGVETVVSPNHPATSVVLANGNTEMRPVVVFSGPLAWPFIANLSIAGNPRVQLIDPEVREKREAEEAAELAKWRKEYEETISKITKKELEEKEAAQKVAREKAEKEEREKAEKSETSTVKTGDQLLVSLGVPHLVQYYVGGIGVGEPENVSSWVTVTSTWWDLLPNNNTIQFGSEDTTNTGGTAAVSWAPANEL